MKIIIMKSENYYDVFIENNFGLLLRMDDEAHSNITQKSEAMGRAKALSVCLSAEIVEE